MDFIEAERFQRWHECAECGKEPQIYISEEGDYEVRCQNSEHKGFKRGLSYTEAWYQGEAIPLGIANKIEQKERKRMEQEYGTRKGKALAKYVGQAVITREAAKEIIETLWKGAPEVEKAKAIILCTGYNLNPLMKHIYLVKYKRWEDGKVVGEDWALIQGIQATRLLAHRKHKFTYLDMSPRIASQAEIEKVLGNTAKPDRIYGFCHLKDLETGAESFGLKGISLKEKIKGVEKGNTHLNMACVRAERQALEYLYPAEMPSEGEIVDERFIEDAVEVESSLTEITEEAPEPDVSPIEKKKPVSGKPTVVKVEEETPEPGGARTGYIDLVWLRESLQRIQAKKVKGWDTESLLRYLRSFGIEGEKVSELVSQLTKEQAEEFARRVQETLSIL